MPITNMYLLVTDKIMRSIKFPNLLAYGMMATAETWTYLIYKTKVFIYV